MRLMLAFSPPTEANRRTRLRCCQFAGSSFGQRATMLRALLREEETATKQREFEPKS